VSFVYDARVDARDVEVAFAVEPGETLGLVGPNGSGKSTVLAVSSGLLRPDRGRVVLDGRVLSEAGADRVQVPPHRRRTALLAQDPLLFPHLSVRDNVAFGPRSAGTGRIESRRRATALLEEVGVADLADRRPGSLSGGQAQRVAVARALAADPELLLLDEPMAALDVDVLPALRQTLRRVLAERTTVVVTHDVLDALLLADRVVVLEGGRVVEEGSSAEVLVRPRSAFAARLAGLNLISGVWRDGVVQAAGLAVHGLVSGEVPASGEAAVGVFRPHAVAVYAEPPHGSPRNAFAVTITDVEPAGDLIRVRGGGMSADVTAQAAAELHLAPGLPVTFSVKATEVTVYRLAS
jgi:molybdate transport system ATP-binding protein